MISWNEVYGIVTERRRNYTPLLAHMHEINQRYDGQYTIPLPNHPDSKKLPPLAPSIVTETIDNMAMHAGSQLPNIFCPPAKGTSRPSLQKASRRKKMLRGVWDENHWELQARKAVRQLTGYSTFVMVVWPDDAKKRVRMELRDPLGALPEERPHSDFDPPNNCAFIHPRPAQWILDRWGHAHVNYDGGVISDHDIRTNQMFDIVEWWDADSVIFGIYGRREQYRHAQQAEPHGGHMHLVTHKNKAGMCPVVTPKRVTLADISSQVSAILGQIDLIGYMSALDLLASQKLLYPDRYITGRTGIMPKLANKSGKWNEGQDGEPNIILNAENVGTLPGTVDPSGKIAADRIERNVRNTVGLIPQFGGETYGALRTGRAIDTLGSFSIDARIEEIHAILETGLEQGNEAIQATQKGYYGDRTFYYFSGVESDDSVTEFTPNDDIEITASTVRYAIRGMNTQSLTAELSQMFGAGAIDLDTYREMHPHVPDADSVKRKVLTNELEEMAMATLPQMMAEGQLLPADFDEGVKAIQAGKTRLEAVQAIISASEERIAEEQEEMMAAAQEQGLPLGGQDVASGQPPGAPPAIPGTEDNARIGPTPDQRGLFNLVGATTAGLRRA
jgi:hypothetical protein